MRFRLNIQRKILFLVAGSMTLIVLASSYLHSGRTRSLIEKDHYQNALRQTVALANRISRYDYFSSLEDLQQEMQLVVSSRPDFRQIEVYENQQGGPTLLATTSPGGLSLSSLWNSNSSAVEVSQSGVSSIQVNRDNSEYWLVTSEITNPQHSGFIRALVLKSYHNELVNSLHRQYNLILIGVVIASMLLLYLLFVYFFRRPVKDIVQTMAEARKGNLAARAVVRRDDELGEIAYRFNEMMDDIAWRSREREELLNQIGDLNNELVRKVHLATTELRAANGNLIRTQQRLANAERLAAIGQVTASLAHEIGTPLNAMAGHLQLLARNHPNSDDTQRRLKIINSQLASVVQTVRSLLERTHRRSIEPKLTDINLIVQELMQLVAPIFESRGIRVLSRLYEGLPCVLADRESLHQVFLNLVNNSLEAMPDGGKLEIVTKYLTEAVVVEVRFIDSGVGIPEDAKEHLFEPLWTTKTSGSGLGLAIAREIVVDHGGEIECVAKVQDGAEFRVTLPAVAPASAESEYREVKQDAA